MKIGLDWIGLDWVSVGARVTNLLNGPHQTARSLRHIMYYVTHWHSTGLTAGHAMIAGPDDGMGVTVYLLEWVLIIYSPILLVTTVHSYVTPIRYR